MGVRKRSSRAVSGDLELKDASCECRTCAFSDAPWVD